jgi:hypothetical protein
MKFEEKANNTVRCILIRRTNYEVFDEKVR